MRVLAHGQERRWLQGVVFITLAGLVALVGIGMIVERSTHTPLVRVGEPAPGFTLPLARGGSVTLVRLRGHPVALAFVPSVRCSLCQTQLRSLESVVPNLIAQGVMLLAVSVDGSAVQRAAIENLGLDFALASEEPTIGEHPAGSAYGVYHLPDRSPGPVDANALVVIDAQGIVRAVRVSPDDIITPSEILHLVASGLNTRNTSEGRVG